MSDVVDVYKSTGEQKRECRHFAYIYSYISYICIHNKYISNTSGYLSTANRWVFGICSGRTMNLWRRVYVYDIGMQYVYVCGKGWGAGGRRPADRWERIPKEGGWGVPTVATTYIDPPQEFYPILPFLTFPPNDCMTI